MGWQTVQELRACLSKVHQFFGDGIGFKLFKPLLSIHIAHRDECIGDHDVCAFDRVFGGVEQFDPALHLSCKLDIILIRGIAVRRTDREREAEFWRSVNEAGADIITVTDPCQPRPLQLQAMFLQRHQVRHDLARM